MAGKKRDDVDLVDDLSRLARDNYLMLSLMAELHFNGVRVVSVADGLDTGDEEAKLGIQIRGISKGGWSPATVQDSEMLFRKRASGGRFQIFLKQERTGIILEANRNDDAPWPIFRRMGTHSGIMCNQATIRIERYAHVVAPGA